ncbi:MAG: hypothetical protein WCO63_11830 [Bacteroidota bacterium]
MFLRLFRTQYSFQLILLLIMGILLWLPAFLHPLPIPTALTPIPIFEKLVAPLRAHLLAATLIAFFMLLSESLVLSLILSANDLAPKSSGMAAIIFFLLSSWQTETLSLHPVLFSNIFFIIFLNYFLKVYEQADPFKEVFSAAFSLSLACVFTFQAFPVLIVIWIGFFIYRALNWREWIISIVGFLLPFLFAGTWYFWNDNLDYFTTDLFSRFHVPSMHVKISILSGVIWAAIAFLSLAALFRTLTIIREKVISIRKNFIFITWFFILSLLVMLNVKTEFAFITMIPIMPASVLIAYHFTTLKKTLWWDIYFSILIFLIFIAHIS